MKDLDALEETNEEEIAQEKSIQEKLEEQKEQQIGKVTDLYSRLEELQERIENEELSPIKRFLLKTKVSILETRIERQITNLDIISLKQQYEEQKDMFYQEHNEELQRKQEELDNIFEEIEQEQRDIEQKASGMRMKQKDYEDINKVGKGKKHGKHERNTYQFNKNQEIEEIIKQKEEKIEELNHKKDLKKEEIINFKKEFIENEKLGDKNFSKQIKEYKPSIWKSIKTALKRIFQNAKDMRANIKEEKAELKRVKKEAKANTRKRNNENASIEIDSMKNEFKNRMECYIPDARDGLTPRERERIEAENERRRQEFEAYQQKLRETTESYKDSARRNQGTQQYSWENGNIVQIRTKNEEAEETLESQDEEISM